MHVIAKDNVTPFISQHGEIIYELIGRAVGEATQRHSVAYVVIPPGKSSLLHYHPEAEESYCILRGQARMLLGDEEATIEAGQTVLIPSLKPHKVFSIGKEDLEFLAFCVPAWEPTNAVFLEDTNVQMGG
jgi:mannose-6-phosphate isomerase-like protein (cupin superfamily)